MLGDLNADIIGTNPQLPKIVDLSWLDVDLSKYDNFPSDNQPVRIVPKLHDLWNRGQLNPGCGVGCNQPNINLVPNAQMLPLGIRAADEDRKTSLQIVKEAKKAIMAGLKGKELSGYLRARFAAKHIELAKDELQKISQEIGLLGNVYIDASAFNSYNDAEQFLRQHRTRLARDILLNSEKLGDNIVSMLASTFHKNVVSSVEYNENLFKDYKDHLVRAGRIPADFVIDSKETLRQAFLYENVKAAEEPKKEEKSLSDAETQAGLEKIRTEQSCSDREARDGILMPRIRPIAAFVQNQLSKGKTAGDVKDMVKARYVVEDIKVAAEALGVVLSKEGLSAANVDNLISSGKISKVMGEELKEIGQSFPLRKRERIQERGREKEIGVKGFLYTPTKPEKDRFDSCRTAIIEALKKGFDVSQIKEKLSARLSSEDSDRVMAEAVSLFNSIPAGFTANKPVKAKDTAVIAEPEPKPTLPDPATIPAQLEGISSVFAGSDMGTIEMDGARKFSVQEVGELFNRQGLDQAIR